ncbi:trypsin 3A1-like [Leguminivora glycinivorella]|uniref:trypsin 3A1-like n=1 Tax=Leguminivora glycinivorella TaxID=1035111 RepID=UPI00200F6FD9|nr:trypsin 3A1-like [Leguminivora glycinivorella]
MMRICGLFCLVYLFGTIDGSKHRIRSSNQMTAAVPVDLRRHPRTDDGSQRPSPDAQRQPDLKSPQLDLKLHKSDSKRQQTDLQRYQNMLEREHPRNNTRRRPHKEKDIARIRNNHDVQYSVNSQFVRSGNLTDTINYPYMAAVMINGRLWCAGAIVDVGWVLTAAHCLNYVLSVLSVKQLNRYVKVRVGSIKPHEGGELVEVTGAVRHPKFEEEPVPHYDIALLKLQDNLEFSKYINLIRIYDGTREPFAQSFVNVAGWGANTGSETAFREHTSNMLVARLKVRTRHYCEDAYQLVSGFQFGEDMFCASLRNGTRDACLFDAGAPAVQHNALMGIMSFGPERCGGMQPAVFIKALFFRDFVKHTIVSYKTTSEIIEAMKEAESAPRPPMMEIYTPSK